MKKGRLALTKDGQITICTSDEEHLGKGRCNHILHQIANESTNDFVKRCEEQNNYIDCNVVLDYSNNLEICENDKRYYLKKTKLDLVNYLYSDELDSQDYSKNIGGSQPKTVTVNDQYVKFDKIELNEFNKVDYAFSYPSITECVCSSLIRNSDIKNRIRCADYRFGTLIDDNGNKMTLSISENYREKFEDEYRLASPFGSSQMPFTLMKTSDYREDIFESIKSNRSKKEIIINSIVKNFGCDYDYIEKQFNDKCAVDILLNNKDITNNPGNFIVVCDNSKKNKPDIICMDYGRCLHFGKTNTYLNESELENFEPFKINLKELKNECKEIKNSIYDDELNSLVCASIDKLFDNLEAHKNLWVDIS